MGGQSMTEYVKLIEETLEQLDEIMNASLKQKVKDIAKKAIGRSVRTKDPMFWPAGMLMLGLTEAADVLESSIFEESADKKALVAKKIRATLDNHVKLWREEYNGRIDFVDDALAGYSLIKMYEDTQKEEIGKAIEDIYEYLKTAPKDKQASIIYNAGKGNTNIFVDGIGQCAFFLAAHVDMKMVRRDLTFQGETHTNVEYYSESDYLAEIDLLYRQLYNFHHYGRDPKSGLIYHGYNLVENPMQTSDGLSSERKGLMGWGRALGWLLLGLSEAAALEKKLSEGNQAVMDWSVFDIIPWYNEVAAALLDYQRPDGGWSWQIQAIDGHIDMSATGMIAYSLAHGLERGVIKDELTCSVKEALELSRKSMLEHIEEGVVKDSLSSCDDFGVHYQTYGEYPWGQGAVLAALAAIAKVLG